MTKKPFLFFFFLLGILLVPYGYISGYIHPAADDFTYAYKGIYGSFFPSLYHEYLHWNGRYTSNALVLINPIVWHSWTMYRLIPLFLILLTWGVLWLFIHQLIHKKEKKIHTGGIALLITLLYLHHMPLLSEGLYWYTATMTYLAGNLATLLYLTLGICWLRKTYLGTKWTHAMLLGILLFLSMGFNEINMLLLLSFSIGFLVQQYIQPLPYTRLGWALVGLSLVFGSLVYFAPGNNVREHLFSTNHQFWYSVSMSLAQSIRFFFTWASSIPLLLASIGYYHLNKHWREQHGLFTHSFYLNPWSSLLLLFALIFIAVFPAYWSTGILGQHRTLNFAYFFFLLAWFINLTVWFNTMDRKHTPWKPLSSSMWIWLGIGISISLITTGNGKTVILDIWHGKAASFDQQMQQRYTSLKGTEDTLYWSPIYAPAKSIFLYDITETPTHWQNECYTLYFRCSEKPIFLKKADSP